MENETLKQVFVIAQKAGDNPQWLNANSFTSKIALNPQENIRIQVSQDGENLIYQAPFLDLAEYNLEDRTKLLFRLLELNGVSQVVTSLVDEQVYLNLWQPVTYDEKLDSLLFIQNYNAIARFYDENRQAFLPVKG